MNKFDEKRLKTACFTGHRQIKESLIEIERRTTRIVEYLIQNNYRYFGAGGARGYDALASEIVLNLKVKYPKIHLILILPFDNQYIHEANWIQSEIDQYHKLKEQASKIVILSSGYSPGIYYRRNRYLVDNSSVCTAYMNRKNSGTGYTVNYAKTQGLSIINVANSNCKHLKLTD